MSLESQVAALVSAASKLTSEIAGKMKGIDQKVNEATDAVPSTIRSLSRANIYVDAENGNDSNDGTPGRPIKTLSQIGRMMVNGSYTVVYLRAGQVHSLSGTLGTSIAVGHLRFAIWGDAQDIKPLISWETGFDGTENTGNFVAIRLGAVVFGGVNFTGRLARPELPVNYMCGVINTYGAEVSAMLTNSELDLESVNFFASGNNGGRSNIAAALDNSLLRHTKGSKLIGGVSSTPPVYALAVNNVTLGGNIKWSDIIPFNPNLPHAQTNINPSEII